MVQRLALLLLAGAAVTLMLLDKSDTRVVERFRAAVLDTASPVLEVLSQPAIAISRVVEEVKFLAYLHEQNARLREENARLMHWRATALRLRQQHAGLAALLDARADPSSTFVSARVIAIPEDLSSVPFCSTRAGGTVSSGDRRRSTGTASWDGWPRSA